MVVDINHNNYLIIFLNGNYLMRRNTVLSNINNFHYILK